MNKELAKTIGAGARPGTLRLVNMLLKELADG